MKKRKKFFTGLLAMLSLIMIAGVIVWRYAANEPQEMKFFCVSHNGMNSYLFNDADMISVDGEQIFVQDRETGVLSLVNIEEPYQVLEEIRDETVEFKNMQAIMQDTNEYIYFLDKDRHTVKIYHKETQEWIASDETALPLKEDEVLFTSVYRNENLITDKNHLKDVSLLYYDMNPEVDCMSKVIHLYPDGGREIIDISPYCLQTLICIFDIPERECLLMLDNNNFLNILDIRTGQLIEADHQTIVDEYMPYAVIDHDTQISPDRRYACQREFLEEYIQVRVWDLETGNYIYNEKFPFGCELQFSGEKEFVCFDYKTMSLFSCDLETGRTTTHLERDYFRDNKAFLNLLTSFYYSREFDACFFLSAEDETMGEGVNVKVTMTDRDGHVLAESEKIHLNHGEFYSYITMLKGCLAVRFAGYNPEQSLDDDENTVIYRALYSVDKEGKMTFSDTYN